MTQEERQQLVARLRAHEVVMWTADIDLAADELERIAQRLAELEQRDRDIANDIRALARWI